jgi:hypothetical protein
MIPVRSLDEVFDGLKTAPHLVLRPHLTTAAVELIDHAGRVAVTILRSPETDAEALAEVVISLADASTRAGLADELDRLQLRVRLAEQLAANADRVRFETLMKYWELEQRYEALAEHDRYQVQFPIPV